MLPLDPLEGAEVRNRGSPGKLRSDAEEYAAMAKMAVSSEERERLERPAAHIRELVSQLEKTLSNEARPTGTMPKERRSKANAR